ncbi:SDR family NAD(P)-dependent oxidoreductase [Nocardia brevicatena]|uniref:SDR family NAD(P)-dependent oxidoreductase n=1 Tax=Nocardia brevicatena TaxID=37327 RepID=UPI00031D3ACF|nr:SDR family oxidoreductase [Nocardia brevicatena]
MTSRSLVVVTGVNMRVAARTFTKTDTEDTVTFEGLGYKLNAAAGAAVELAKRGHLVHMMGSHEHHLRLIQKYLMPAGSRYDLVDLLDTDAVAEFAEEVGQIARREDISVHLVHYAGISESTVPMPRGTIFLDPWETPAKAIPEIVGSNTVTWLNLLQAMRPMFRRQERSKVVLISAVAATRTGRLHGLDAIQKAAAHAMARTLALDLTKENIFVTEVMPGLTDTGFYDADATLEAVTLAAREYGYDYTEETFPLFSSRKVGEAVGFAIDIDAHVREISLIPYGQWPHLGA